MTVFRVSPSVQGCSRNGCSERRVFLAPRAAARLFLSHRHRVGWLLGEATKQSNSILLGFHVSGTHLIDEVADELAEAARGSDVVMVHTARHPVSHASGMRLECTVRVLWGAAL